MFKSQAQNTDKNTTKAIEGEIVEKPKVKSARIQDLPLKQRKFIKYYKETGNGTKSAKLAGYAESSAYSTASRILKSDKVLSILNDSVEEAQEVIRSLVRSDDPKISLAASREVLDRTIGKPIQRSESVQVNITVESMLEAPK